MFVISGGHSDWFTLSNVWLCDTNQWYKVRILLSFHGHSTVLPNHDAYTTCISNTILLLKIKGPQILHQICSIRIIIILICCCAAH